MKKITKEIVGEVCTTLNNNGVAYCIVGSFVDSIYLERNKCEPYDLDILVNSREYIPIRSKYVQVFRCKSDFDIECIVSAMSFPLDVKEGKIDVKIITLERMIIRHILWADKTSSAGTVKQLRRAINLLLNSCYDKSLLDEYAAKLGIDKVLSNRPELSYY